MIHSSNVDHILTQHSARLRICLQHASGDSHGPEEGSDAWLLLHALIGSDLVPGPGQQHPTFLSRFEQSGRWLAEQHGKLDLRLQGLQSYVDALTSELATLLPHNPTLLLEATSRLYQLQSACALALARGYQSAIDQTANDQLLSAQLLERRFLALQRINGISNSAIDLDQALSVTSQAVADELGADLCTIYFYDELQRMLTLRATNGPRPLGGMHFTLRLGEGYSGWVAEKGQPLLVRNALADAHFATEVRAYSSEYHGLMALPIIFFGNVVRLIGVISVQSCMLRDFTSQERNFVEVVAGIIAINIENGRLYEQTDEQLRRKVHELATIHRVSSIIASTLNLDEVLQIITTQAVHLSGAERSCIFELDPNGNHLHVLAHYGLNTALVRDTHLSVGQCCAGRTVQTGHPSMAVDCLHSDEHCFLSTDPAVSSDIHSVLCVPLQARSNILGCICIYSNHRHLLSHEQMQLVVTFANEAAIAIENARLYEETRRGLELKSILLRELHHRVKNNLATVAGILSLQRRRTKSPEVRYILAESVNRVQGLAATHDLLSHEDVSAARVDDIARKIVGVANANLKPPEAQFTFEVEPCSIVIPSRAVTILALILNEMVSNAIKHGMLAQNLSHGPDKSSQGHSPPSVAYHAQSAALVFGQGEKKAEGTVTIRGREVDGIVIVQVIDTGPGLQWKPEEEDSNEGLGLLLIKNLVDDLGGQFALLRAENEAKTIAEVRFPLTRRPGQQSS